MTADEGETEEAGEAGIEPIEQDVDELAQLRLRVINLGERAIDRLEADLRNGSLAQKNAAIKLIAPFLLRSLEVRDDDAVLSEMKKQFELMMVKVMGAPDTPTQVTGHEPGEVHRDATEDRPPE